AAIEMTTGRSANVRVLATSGEPLGTDAEAVLGVSPLGVADGTESDAWRAGRLPAMRGRRRQRGGGLALVGCGFMMRHQTDDYIFRAFTGTAGFDISAFTRTPRRAYSMASERATSHPLGPWFAPLRSDDRRDRGCSSASRTGAVSAASGIQRPGRSIRRTRPRCL